MKKLLVEILNLLPWKLLLRMIWSVVQPKLQAKADASDPVWDNIALDAADLVITRILADK